MFLLRIASSWGQGNGVNRRMHKVRSHLEGAQNADQSGDLTGRTELAGLDVLGQPIESISDQRIVDLFNVVQYALDLKMTARYEWRGTRQDARSAVGVARRALSAI